MSPHLQELLNLVVRWIHLIAGIMWVGNSMLFNWLDRNLIPKEGGQKGLEGKIWMLHSGGFYEVDKTMTVPAVLPGKLHWFWVQATLTWVSGFFLLVLVYYMGSGAFLIDPNVSDISVAHATAVGIGTLVVGWIIYDGLWRFMGPAVPGVAAAVSLILLLAADIFLCKTLSGRAAYLHMGALMGTLMAANVWAHILPSQRQLVAATKRGEPPEAKLALRAKQRSIHNNYLTFPVLFIMLSHHFPSTYGREWGWVTLALLIVAGAAVRHCMNIRYAQPRSVYVAGVIGAAAFIALFYLMAPAQLTVAAGTGEPVSFTEARAIIIDRCTSCHSSEPTDPVLAAATGGVNFDTPAQIKTLAQRIKVRVADSQTMPLANKTGMLEEERDIIRRWVEQGASISE